MATDADAIEIKLPDLSRVALEPGDVLLVRCGRLSPAQAKLVKLRLSQIFPGHEIALLSSQVELAVVRPTKGSTPTSEQVAALFAATNDRPDHMGSA